MHVRIKPSPCASDCLPEAEWDQIGWGPLGTVGLCGSHHVSVNEAKLPDVNIVML